MTRKMFPVAVVLVLATSAGVALVAQDSAITAGNEIDVIAPLINDTSADDFVRSLETSLGEPTLLPQRKELQSVSESDPFGESRNARPVPDPISNTEGERKLREARARRHRFLELAEDFANLDNPAELDRMSAELRARIAEESARQKVAEIEQLLKLVINKYPSTQGAGRAQKMLAAVAATSAGESAVVEPASAEESAAKPAATESQPPLPDLPQRDDLK